MSSSPVSGWISKIQRYSTQDGPGVRSTVFTVGCNLRCWWCANPELIEPGEKILYHKERCTRCGACVSVSRGTIQLGEDGCIIDRAACTNLRECAEACFFDAYEFLGYQITSDGLAGQLLRDQTFYQRSGGGVTFSGGEAALQDEFVRQTAHALRAKGVHVALDTAGHVAWEKLERLCRDVDLVLFDMKVLDDETHKRYTGVDSKRILANAVKLAQIDVSMILRLVLIPGVNDSKESISRRMNWAKTLGDAVQQVDILPYHELGTGKYVSLGLPYRMPRGLKCSDSSINHAVQEANRLGLKVTVGG